MKSFKRIISTVLTAAMITASASLISAAQVSFTDTAGHWAWDNGCIPYLVEKDVHLPPGRNGNKSRVHQNA